MDATNLEVGAMTLRELLTTRYAPVKGISTRTIAIYGHTIDRFSEYLGRDAVIADLEEDTIAAFLAWRGRTVHSASRGIPSAGTVRKDRTQLLALALYAFRKRLIEEFPIVRQVQIGRPHVGTPVTSRARMPSSA